MNQSVSRDAFARRSDMNFDAAFLTRLQQRDPETCTFLVSAMTPVLEARLRYRLRDQSSIEDIRNETFYRLFRLVDGGRVRTPSQLGSFVRGVCDRVAQESHRKARHIEYVADAMDPWDGQPHLDQFLIGAERHALVRRELMKMSAIDRSLIVEMHCLGRDRNDLARALGITPSGLNVRLCRAMKRLRARVLPLMAGAPVARKRCRRSPVRAIRTRRTAAPAPWATMAA